MSKTKTPFFSLGAHGTVGKAITAQKRGTASLLRLTPMPRDPYTLPQAYHRWLYQDYCAQWAALSEATKQTWRSAASRLNMGGMAFFLRDRLTTLPDIAGMWHLDELAGATARDSSKNANHGTFFGTSHTTGPIASARLFDGVDDYIDCGSDPSLDLTGPLSAECFCRTPTRIINQYALCKYGIGAGERSWILLNTNTQHLQALLRKPTDAGWVIATDPAFTPLDTWIHLGFTWDGSILILYVRGREVARDDTYSGLIQSSPKSVTISNPVNKWKGPIDHSILYDRTLTPSDMLRHSLRRYPS